MYIKPILADPQSTLGTPQPGIPTQKVNLKRHIDSIHLE